MQCGALHVYDAYLGKCCVDRGSRIGNPLSVRHEFYVNEGNGRVEMHHLNLRFNIFMVKTFTKLMTNICSSRHKQKLRFVFKRVVGKGS